MIKLQLAIVLLAIVLGTRLRGIGLGIMGGLGLAILTFGFHIRPTKPPIDVLMIVTAVVTASSTLDAAGGLRYLTKIAEGFMRKYPHRITFISPLVVYVITFLGGTGHTIYAILPVIADVAEDVGVRPSKPLSAAVIAAQQAVLASPISAPTALIVGILGPYGIELIDILKVCVPATFMGVLCATLVASKQGKDLQNDPIYLASLQALPQKMASVVRQESTVSHVAKRAIFLFMLGIACIMSLGAFTHWRPSWEVNDVVQPIGMPVVIVIVMLAVAALIVLVCQVPTQEIVRSNVFTSGIQAVIAILGISWLGDTFVTANMPQIMEVAKTQLVRAPWQFSMLLFFMSILFVSQAATIQAIMPLGIALGFPATTLLTTLPAVNGLFFIPNYPTIVAAMNLDRTGTTRVGKFLLNHSFMVPGLVATTIATVMAQVLVPLLV